VSYESAIEARHSQPGIDGPRDLLVPKCEWHISPLGRSYFVNHNTRTTSWKKPMPEHPPGSLTSECIIDGHSKVIWSLAFVGTDCNVMSASEDGSIRQWTRDGKTIGQPWRSNGGGVTSITVSPDETMVVSGSEDGRLQLWNMKDGRIVGDPWEGHNAAVKCLDWSPNAQEIASGSQDGTIRRWNPDTGRQIAPQIEAGQGWLNTVKYSPQGDKFASSGCIDMIRVWSKDDELLIETKGGGYWVMSLCWSKDGTCIFSGSADGTIRKWGSINGEELVLFQGHNRNVRSLCLSLDERHLVSASQDSSVRIWDLETNQLVGKPLLHDDEIRTLAMSRDGKYVASTGLDHRIYLWNFEAALKEGGNQVCIILLLLSSYPLIRPLECAV
jgi:WD40 repeat protein